MKEYICNEVSTKNGGYLEIETELIRCKDCKYWDVSKSNIMNHTCHWGYFLKKEDDYCSWAEPKDTTEEVRKQLKDMEQRREMDRKK